MQIYNQSKMVHPKKAFTLIEVVIAIMIFSVGVLVSLRAITYFVGIGNQVQKKAQATLLAKEALDILYNQRDSNIRKGVKRNCAEINLNDIEDACAYEFEDGKSYIVGFDGSHNYKIQPLSTSDDLKDTASKLGLVQTTQGDKKISFFTHPAFANTAQIENSQFSRIVTFSSATIDEGQTLPTEKVLKVTIKASYLPDNTDRIVILESFLSAGEKAE